MDKVPGCSLVVESNPSKFTATCKYRRKRRSWHPYPTRNITTRSQNKTEHGLFERLPDEVFDLILDHLSVMDISLLSMVSQAISSHIVSYVSTLTWKKRMIVQKFHNSAPKEHILDHYRSLGLLFKRCTLLLPTKERLKFTYSRFSQIPCFTMEGCVASPGCLGLASLGVFLQTLIAGWDELECHRVFNFLCESTNLSRKMEAVVTGRPGASHRLELQIRLFCRNVLLDHWQNQRDSLFWLTRILQSWPIVSQARLLFIVYGPVLLDGKLAWWEVCDTMMAQSSLWDLAKAIVLLYSDTESKDWSSNAVLAIVDEMTVVPQRWHTENMARLLILCGNSICYNVLASKAINGRLFEISRLMVFLIQICERDGYCMSWSVKMMQQICKVLPSASDKWSLIQSVENMFSEITMEMNEVIMAGNGNENMDTFQNLCSFLNASAHFHTEMLYMFLKADNLQN